MPSFSVQCDGGPPCSLTRVPSWGRSLASRGATLPSCPSGASRWPRRASGCSERRQRAVRASQVLMRRMCRIAQVLYMRLSPACCALLSCLANHQSMGRSLDYRLHPRRRRASAGPRGGTVEYEYAVS